MKLTPEKLLESVKTILGDRTDDEALQLLEDVKDTVTVEEGEDWKAKYDELDKTWREKYKARFFEGNKTPENKDENENPENDNEPELKTRYEDLFTTEEK